MMKVIVFEGPDGAGKTHTIRELLNSHPDKFKLKPTSRSTTSHSAGQDFYAWFDGAYAPDLPEPGFTYLLDRSVLSNIAYGTLRDSDYESKHDFTTWADFCRKHSVHGIVLLRTPFANGYEDEGITLSADQDHLLCSLYTAIGVSLDLAMFTSYNKGLHDYCLAIASRDANSADILAEVCDARPSA